MTPDERPPGAVIVNAVRDVDEPITVVPYDPEWRAEFAQEAVRLGDGLDDTVLAIEHIGSTAVEGLAAKPIVDVMVGVSDLNSTESLAAQLAVLGYEDCGGAEGRRYFRKRGTRQHFNVHVMEHGSPMWEANILVRDYLRSDDEAALWYANAKQAAAATAPMLLAYSNLKTAIINELLQRTRS
jgi:GrpB-like predicted nucleotidyltransferase (UPF0157 family)